MAKVIELQDFKKELIVSQQEDEETFYLFGEKLVRELDYQFYMYNQLSSSWEEVTINEEFLKRIYIIDHNIKIDGEFGRISELVINKQSYFFQYSCHEEDEKFLKQLNTDILDIENVSEYILSKI
jgi:hypothetical protein